MKKIHQQLIQMDIQHLISYVYKLKQTQYTVTHKTHLYQTRWHHSPQELAFIVIYCSGHMHPGPPFLKTVTVVQTQIRTLTEWQVIHPVIKSKSGVLGDGGVEEKDWEEEEECCRDGQIEEGEEESSSGWRLRSASASDPPSAYLNCGVQKSSWIEMHKDTHTSEAKGKHTPSASTFWSQFSSAKSISYYTNVN